jgi:hypothetical protein
VADEPRRVARGELRDEQCGDRSWTAAARPQPLNSTTVTINLIAPQTYFAPRRNSFDLRVGKIIRFGRTRTQVGVDVFNLTNDDEVTSYSQTFSPPTTTWLTPTGITPARYVRLNAQFDF